MAKINRCVVRNEAYRRSGISLRQRHNERQNIDYANDDIVKERSSLNVQYKSCPGTYEQEFSRMVDSGAISLRGLQKDAKVFDELVFDVNSEYFETHGDGSPAGGYDYAKQFFAEAYRLAVKEIGGEAFVLSAVLHADERNRALSEKLGRDVFHYHLHVIYVPVVDKEIYFKKNNKNPELAGKLREVVKQVSHSKKWPRFKEENGQWFNAYSLLQDQFFEHMREAGFTDFERGERGSTAEHLSALDYKIQQDKARAAELAATVEEQRKAAAALGQQAAQTAQQLASLEKKTAIAKKDADAFVEIDAIGKPALLGGFNMTAMELKKLKRLAKEGQQSRAIISDLRGKNEAQATEITKMEARLKQYGEGIGITDKMQFLQAKHRAPRRLLETVSDIMRQPPERTAPARTAERKRTYGHEL